jgi:Taurine catabolism dioxygenase TauD, TfdA family
MLLERISFDESAKFSIAVAHDPVVMGRGVADPSLLWLNVAENVSRTFGDATSPLRGLALTAGEAKYSPDRNPPLWLSYGVSALSVADAGLVGSLRHAASAACPVIVVRGLPSDAVSPTTPYDGVVDLTESYRAIINLHAVVGSLGLHPVAYAKENSSTLHAVCPVTGGRGKISSHGYDTASPFHTDYADRPIDEPRCDQSPAAAALAFAVERAELATPMEYVPVCRLLSVLSAEQIRTGHLDEFSVRAPAIFCDGQATRVRRLFLARDDRCRLNLGTMTGLTPRASRLLGEIREILSDESLVERIHVRRGDVVVMDNQRVVHRRASFAPRWDGTDRYFVRMSAVRDPRAGLSEDPRRPWIWS